MKKKKEDVYIYTLHRLDKYTSGIALFGKNKNFSTKFAQNLSSNNIKKIYIARIDGDFRKIIKTLLDENKVLKKNDTNYKKLNDYIDNFCNTNEMKLNENINKIHLFKDNMFLYENDYEIGKNEYLNKMKELIEKIKNQENLLKDTFDIDKYKYDHFNNFCNNKNKIKNDEINKNIDEIYYKYFLIDFGYIYCKSKKTFEFVFTKENKINNVLKPTITKFMFLSYNDKLNESLIICLPITGRTHQIRAHLKYLNFPISNDPNYNIDFEKNYLKKSKYVYFGDEINNEMNGEINEEINNNKINNDEIYNDKINNNEINNDKINNNEINNKINENIDFDKYNYFPLIPFMNTSFNWLYDDNINLHNEYEENFIKKHFFKKISNITYHSSGIFLHSCRYLWQNVFDVFSLLPKWTYSFYLSSQVLSFITYGNMC